MSRSIFGLTVSPVLAWCFANPARFAVPCVVLARRKSLFAARVHGVDLRRGDRLALHASASDWSETRLRDAALVVRAAMDTTIPTHAAPYRALAGRVVAVATLTSCTTRERNITGNVDPWRTPTLRAALGVEGDWWAELADVMVLPSPVEAAGGVGLWSLEHHTAFALRDQTRALEARGRAA